MALTVEHMGISPQDYNKRNYVDEGALERGRQLREMEPLPALMPVTKPQRVPSSTNPRKVNNTKATATPEARGGSAGATPHTQALDTAIQNDLKQRGLKR